MPDHRKDPWSPAHKSFDIQHRAKKWYDTKSERNVRVDVSIRRTNLKYCGSRPKFVFSPTFIHLICPNNCGVVFWRKCILVFEKFFSCDRSNMQIFTPNITRVVWPHVTNLLDLRYFCRHNPLLYDLNLILCHYWSWQRKYLYFGEYFCLAFKRQKDGYKVTVKISLCNCVVLSWDEHKVWQNLLAST